MKNKNIRESIYAAIQNMAVEYVIGGKCAGIRGEHDSFSILLFRHLTVHNKMRGKERKEHRLNAK